MEIPGGGDAGSNSNISYPIGKAANAGKHPNGPVFSVRQSAGTRPNDYIRLYDAEFE